MKKYITPSGNIVEIGLNLPSDDRACDDYLCALRGELVKKFQGMAGEAESVWAGTGASPDEITSASRSFAQILAKRGVVQTKPEYVGQVRKAMTDAWFSYRDSRLSKPSISTDIKTGPDTREPGTNA